MIHRVRRPVVALAVLCGLLVASGSRSAEARDRFRRWLGTEQGLPATRVLALGQDADGFLWIGTAAGLVRHDGAGMRAFGERALVRGVRRIAAGASVWAIDTRGQLFEIDREGREASEGRDPDDGGARAVQGPWGTEAVDVAVDGGGTVWVAGAEGLWRRADGWQRVRGIPDGERIRRLRPAADGLVVLTSAAVWRLGATATRVGAVRAGVDVAVAGARIVVATWPDRGRLVEVTRAGTRELVALDARPIAVVARGDTVWASFDRYLVALRPDRAPEVLGPDELGRGGGGPLLVDREHSLWVGNLLGLAQYPEPDAVRWTDADGLPSAHTRYLAATEEGVWVSTWQTGFGLIAAQRRDARTFESITVRTASCRDGAGDLWAVSSEPAHGIVVRRGGRFEHFEVPGLRFNFGCASAPDGSVWFTTDRGIWTAGPGGEPRAAGWLRVDGASRVARRLYVDRTGRLWASGNEHVCYTARAELAWTCERLPGIGHAMRFAETDAGALWLATELGGVWARAPSGWTPIARSGADAGYTVQGVRPARGGGMWVLGSAGALRVQPVGIDDWRVVERLSQWHGVTGGASDILEQDDGAVWVATSGGVVEIPAAARSSRAAPPPVRITEIRSAGTAVTRSALSLPHGDNDLAVTIAALSFRDRARLVYRYRLGAGEPWLPLTAPTLQLADLLAGDHQVELGAGVVRADGDIAWASAPPVAVTVAPPWYLDPWTLCGIAAALLALLYALHRVRLAVVVRAERQRLRIAMDLHDEMGSGLGSIGLVAGMAADDESLPEDIQAMAARIAHTAGELGESLHDIVWSLRAGSDRLEALAGWLTERASGLFPGPRPRLVMTLPDPMPAVILSLEVRRNLQLIAVEALHNAAKYADAAHVELGLAPAGRGRWRLWVRDDGRGIGPRQRRLRGGLGLSSMRTRAGEIGAALRIDSEPGRGTLVEVSFSPTAHDRRTAARATARIHRHRRSRHADPHRHL